MKTKEEEQKKKKKKRNHCGGGETHLDDIIDVNLAVLVVVQGLGDAQQLVLRDVLDLPHDGDELIDADQVLPEGIEQTGYRKRLCDSCFGEPWKGETGDEKKKEKKKERKKKRKRHARQPG